MTLQLNAERGGKDKAETQLAKLRKETQATIDRQAAELKEIQLKLKGYQVIEKAFEIEKKQKEDALDDLSEVRLSFKSCKA